MHPLIPQFQHQLAQYQKISWKMHVDLTLIQTLLKVKRHMIYTYSDLQELQFLRQSYPEVIGEFQY